MKGGSESGSLPSPFHWADSAWVWHSAGSCPQSLTSRSAFMHGHTLAQGFTVVLSRTWNAWNSSRVNLTIISFVMTTACHPDANTWLSHPECFICLPSTYLLMWFSSLSYLPSLPFLRNQIPLHTATITTLHTRKEILHLMWHLWHWSHYSRNRLFIKQLHFLCDILWSANNQ